MEPASPHLRAKVGERMTEREGDQGREGGGPGGRGKKGQKIRREREMREIKRRCVCRLGG